MGRRNVVSLCEPPRRLMMRCSPEGVSASRTDPDYDDVKVIHASSGLASRAASMWKRCPGNWDACGFAQYSYYFVCSSYSNRQSTNSGTEGHRQCNAEISGQVLGDVLVVASPPSLSSMPYGKTLYNESQPLYDSDWIYDTLYDARLHSL